MDASLTVLAVVFDILGPRLAPDVDHNTIGRLRELHHHQWWPVTLLIQIRVVVLRESLWWKVLDWSDVFLVYRVFPLACDADVIRVPATSELHRSLRFVERNRLPVKDLVQFQEHTRLSPVVAVVTLPRALFTEDTNQEAASLVARPILIREVLAVNERLRLLHLIFIEPQHRLDVIREWLVAERLALHKADHCTAQVRHRPEAKRWKSLQQILFDRSRMIPVYVNLTKNTKTLWCHHKQQLHISLIHRCLVAS